VGASYNTQAKKMQRKGEPGAYTELLLVHDLVAYGRALVLDLDKETAVNKQKNSSQR
jgi:hypothetical protein